MAVSETPNLDALVVRIRRQRPVVASEDVVRQYYVQWALHTLTWDEVLTLCTELLPDVQWNKSTESLDDDFSRLFELRLRTSLLGVIMMRSENSCDGGAFSYWCQHLRESLTESIELLGLK